MADKDDMDDADINLFRNTIGPVKRIQHDRVLPVRKKPRPVPYKTLAENRKVLEWLNSPAGQQYTKDIGRAATQRKTN